MATKVEFVIKDEAHEKFLRKYQEVLQSREPEEGGQKITLSDTAERIFSHGVPRLMATTKYALRKAGKLAPYKKPEPKAAPVKKAPKAKAAPAAKPAKKTAAKGPLARKQASTAKAPKVRKAKAQATGSSATGTAAMPASAPAEPVLD